MSKISKEAYEVYGKVYKIWKDSTGNASVGSKSDGKNPSPYPLAKRFFIIPQLVLAMIYNWGSIIGWVTIQSPYKFDNILILYSALIIWTIIYDTVYATQDEMDDRKMSLYSSVIFFDSKRFQIIN